MLTEKADLKERISTFAGTVAEKLRNDKLHTNAIDVFLISNPFRQDLEQYLKTGRRRNDFPTTSTIEINRLAIITMEMIYKPGISYKKAGVIAHSITPADSFQMKIFEGRIRSTRTY